MFKAKNPDQTTYTRAIVVDLRKGAGRLRYAVFTAAGRPI